MKSLLSVFLVILLSKGCSQGQDLSDVKVVYGASTRGYHRMIVIEKNVFSLISEHDGKPKVIELTDEQWKRIADLFKKIDLKTFDKLEGTTMERAYDGKPHADMSITVGDKTYTTKGFDHTIPPVKIKEFVDLINTIADNSDVKNPILGSYSVEELMSRNVSEKEYFISFDAKKVSGFMGCNMYSGTYEFQEASITLGPLMVTKKYCEGIMDDESLWLKVSSEISTFKLNNKTILLYDDNNNLVLKATKK
ncbi:META domain-containing protein [Flavobacterium cucumis]|uniref:META domain-containing protein n=1 Tax=Flavobacterium cucumis TaxID=416016 RepID=A0A1M7ZUC8_9FLAO|nr:META domain-containing protein [Flavobacterium cucumis]SHO72501.1 META domain-containing protein [Flavobacterium cucumis]